MNLHGKIMNLQAQDSTHDYLRGHRDARHAAAELAAEADGLMDDLLAALEAGYSDLRTRLIQYAQSNFGASYDEAATYTDTAVPVLEKMRAAIAKAKGEA